MQMYEFLPSPFIPHTGTGTPRFMENIYLIFSFGFKIHLHLKFVGKKFPLISPSSYIRVHKYKLLWQERFICQNKMEYFEGKKYKRKFWLHTHQSVGCVLGCRHVSIRILYQARYIWYII